MVKKSSILILSITVFIWHIAFAGIFLNNKFLPLLDTTLPRYHNPYGLLVSDANGYTIDPPDAVNLCHDLGVAYARIAVSNQVWYDDTGKITFLDEYNAYTKSKPSIKILLNVNWRENVRGASPFPGATPEYKAFIKDITDTLTSPGYVPPAVIVVENEENNVEFHVIESSEDEDKYLDMLSFVAKECHNKSLKMCNGGLTDIGVILAVRDYFLNTLHDTARAETFINNSMPARSVLRIDSPHYQDKMERTKYYLDHYGAIDLDYVNIHWYEPIKLADWYYPDRATDIDTAHMSPGSLVEVKAYFSNKNTVGGHQLIVNEAGQITPATEIPEELTCALQDLPYVIWYSGDRDEYKSKRPYRQVALHTSLATGMLPFIIRPNGVVFRETIASIIANPYIFCRPL